MKAAFTIATSDYLAQAKTAGDSLLAVNPEYVFFIMLLDKVEEKFDTSFFKPLIIIEVGNIGIPYLNEMVNRYTLFELSNAIKPFCAEYLFRNYNTVLYFDSDILVYDSFSTIDHLLQQHEILLCPHTFTPIPNDGFDLSDRGLLNSGVYNAGFFALINSYESVRFLSWWKEHLRTECLVQFENGLFVDQIWLNLVPVYFKNVGMIEHLGYNVASWNLHERILVSKNGKYFVNDEFPLIFFHFSGYNFNQPEMLSKFQNRYSFDTREDVHPLFKDYRKRVINNNFNEFSLIPCYYSQLKKEANEEPLLLTSPGNKSLLSLCKDTLKKIFIYTGYY